MADLEELLRSELQRWSEGFTPPTGPEEIEARALAIHRRRQRRRLAAGGLAATAAVVLTAVLLPGRGDRGDDVRIGHEGPGTTTTTQETTTTTSTLPSTTTTTAATTTSTSAPPPESPATTAGPPAAPTAPAVGPETPLSRSGIGPIRAGMTLREAEAAAGVTITPQEHPPAGFTCIGASIGGMDALVHAERTGAAGEDLMGSTIRMVSLSLRGSTEEGVAIGDPVGELSATYGTPTRSRNYDDGEQYLVFESGGYAYAFLTNATEVIGIEAGDPRWVGDGDTTFCRTV
jgi:hypothetical protein